MIKYMHKFSYLRFALVYKNFCSSRHLSLSVCFFGWTGKTDPFVVLNLGDQEIRSKKNSQTTVIGPPGEPIWNQVIH